MRDEIERRLGLRALDIYGLSEMMGPGVASECHPSRSARTSARTTSSSRWSIRTPAAVLPEDVEGELVLSPA